LKIEPPEASQVNHGDGIKRSDSILGHQSPVIVPQWMIALAMLFAVSLNLIVLMWLFLVDVELKQNEVTDDGIGSTTKILRNLGARRSNVQGAALEYIAPLYCAT
jgi:hypothetical protein